MKCLLILVIFISSYQLFAQQPDPAKQLQSYRNDTLKPDDPRLLEKPAKTRTADDVLNKTIRWKNPYPMVENTATADFAYEKIGKTPAVGVYPRIFTAPDEFGDIKKRLETTEIGNHLLALSNRELSAMQKGEGDYGKFYQALKNNQLSYDFGKLSLPEMSNRLAIQGLLAQVYDDKNLLAETGAIAGNLLKIMMKQIDATPIVAGKELMVKEQVYSGAKLAKLFDFTAAAMPEADKKQFIEFLSKETFGKYGDGMQLPPHWRRWNFMASAIAYPLTVLAIEGQKGYDKRIYERGAELTRDYLTYAFSPEGMSSEGITYTFNSFTDDMLFMTAIERRDKNNLFANPHFRAIPDWLIYALSPNPDALWISHGDTGSASTLPWVMLMQMKYFYPQDNKIDYLFANAIPTELRQLPDVSAFVFCADISKKAADYNALPPDSLPLTFFSPMRGSFIARDKWGKDAVMFQLDARQDVYFDSHDHADRGNFELGANGRLWVVDGWRSSESKYHSVITIDGRGQGYFATPASWLNFVDKPEAVFGVIDYKYSFDWSWIKSPVADLMLGKTVAPQWQTGVYADTAKRLHQYYPDAKPERDPLRKVAEYYNGNLETNPLIWNEDTYPMRIPNFQVENAFRTAGLVKGTHSYMMIVDDLKKDNQERLYEWLLPMPLDVEVVSIKQLVDVTQGNDPANLGFNSFANKGISGEYDIILGDKTMPRNMDEVDTGAGENLRAGRFSPQKGNPQLLVRVLRTDSFVDAQT